MDSKILRNTRIGISEEDIIKETDKQALFDWSIEVQKDIDDLRGRLDQAKDSKAFSNEAVDQEKFRKWEYVSRIQGTLKQRIQHRISALNQIEKDERKKRFECSFIKQAREVLSEDMFKHIKSMAMDAAGL